MRHVGIRGLVLIAVLGGCTATRDLPHASVGPAITSGSAITSPAPADTVSPDLRGVHWVLTSLRRGRMVTDVRPFTPVVLELTTHHFTMDTGIGVSMFHYAGGPNSFVLGTKPPHQVRHGGYTGSLGPAPQALDAALQTSISVRYAVTGNRLVMTVGPMVLHFRGAGPSTLHYWSEPDN